MRYLKLNLPTPNYSRENLLYLKEIQKALSLGKIRPAQAEAEILIGHFGRFDRLDFLTGKKNVPPRIRRQIQKALKARLAGRPLSHLTGSGDFLGRSFKVSADTLIPRPETEILAQEASKMIAPGFRVLDLGTGSGCLAVSLTILRPDCRMTALDISPKALKIAAKNASKFGVSKRIRFLKSDLFESLGRTKKEFWDVLVSNPPYIASDEIKRLPKEVQREPRIALDGGQKGIEIIFRILKEAPFFLKRGGWIFMEIGYGQRRLIEKELRRSRGYREHEFIKDFAGIDRILKARTNLI
jgi:release factor glutamine methyltransferase